eukprot:403345856
MKLQQFTSLSSTSFSQLYFNQFAHSRAMISLMNQRQIITVNAHSMRMRQFSTFSRVQGNSVKISSHSPPKLRIPVSNDGKQAYDFSLIDSETVAHFEQKVKEQTGLKSFTLDKQADKESKIGDVIKTKFQMEVNSKPYDVYPLFQTMVDKNYSAQSHQLIDQVFEGKSIPISRRIILYHYFDQMLKAMSKQINQKQLTEQEVNQAIQRGLDEYVKTYKSQIYERPSQQLELAQQELAFLKAKQSQLEKRAKSHASKVLYGCLAMAMTQLTGMGYLIFVHLSWEDMEPVTYMVSAFYAMIGALYYVIYKGDFEMASAYDLFQKRKYDGLVKKENFDDEKIEFLETYINELQEQLGILQTEENQQREKSQGDNLSIKINRGSFKLNFTLIKIDFGRHNALVQAGVLGGLASLLLYQGFIYVQKQYSQNNKENKTISEESKVASMVQTMKSKEFLDIPLPFSLGKYFNLMPRSMQYTFCSGMMSNNIKSPTFAFNEEAHGNIEVQTRTTIQNIKQLLTDNQQTVFDIVKMRVFLTDLDTQLETVQRVISEEFSLKPIEPTGQSQYLTGQKIELPAIVYVGVVKLPLPHGLIEIECETVKPLIPKRQKQTVSQQSQQ